MDNYYDHAAGRWVTDWDRYQAVACQPRFAALRGLVLHDPHRAWPLLLELLASVPEDTVHYVGAGDLEEFVCQHGAAFVSQLEAEAMRNARFRDAVLEVNLARGLLPAPIEQRLVAAFGPRFTLLDGAG